MRIRVVRGLPVSDSAQTKAQTLIERVTSRESMPSGDNFNRIFKVFLSLP